MLNIYIYSRSDHQSNRCVLRLEIATVSAVVKYKQQNKEAKLFPTSNIAQFDPFVKWQVNQTIPLVSLFCMDLSRFFKNKKPKW